MIRHIVTTNHILYSAFRYALGRKTTIVAHTVTEILNNWDKLDENDRKGMVKERFRYKDTHGNLGGKIDEIEWQRIIDKSVEEYIEKNGRS